MSKPKLPGWAQDHLDRYLRTDGAEGHLMDFTVTGGKPDTSTLLLTTTGRVSGEPILLPLIYGADGGRYVIIASKAGAPEHPSWYLNLQAHSEVAVQVANKKFRAVARTESGAERQRLWQLMAAIYPPYNDYQKMAAREIPVVVLEPLPD